MKDFSEFSVNELLSFLHFRFEDFNEKAPARTAYMATLPRAAKVEIDVVAIVGDIVDVEGYTNDASRIQGILVVAVVMIQCCLTFYKTVVS